MRLRSQLPASWLWRRPAASARRRTAMRAMRPGMVRAPWRSSESCPLRVSKTDSIHWRTAPSAPWRRGSSLRSGLSRRPPRSVMSCSKSAPAKPLPAIAEGAVSGRRCRVVAAAGAAGEALVGEQRAPGERQALQDLGVLVALGDVGGDELKADRHPVGGAHQDQPKTPEEAVLAAAVAVGGVTGQLRAARRLA